MLVSNDFLNLEDFVIDIEKKSTTIKSCEINIALKIWSKESYIKNDSCSTKYDFSNKRKTINND